MAGLNVGGSIYQRWGSYWGGSTTHAYARADASASDNQLAALQGTLFTTLQGSVTDSVNLTARIASQRMQAEARAKLQAKLDKSI